MSKRASENKSAAIAAATAVIAAATAQISKKKIDQSLILPSGIPKGIAKQVVTFAEPKKPEDIEVIEDEDSSDTEMINSQVIVDSDMSSDTGVVDDNETDDENSSTTLKFAKNLNILKDMKDFVFLKNVEKNQWFRVNFVKYAQFNDKMTNEVSHAIHLDTNNFVFVVPSRQRAYILKEVFGINDAGETIPKIKPKFQKNVSANYASFPGLEFAVIPTTDTEGKTYNQVQFRSNLLRDSGH